MAQPNSPDMLPKRFEKIRYGTIIPLALVGYELAILISYSMSVSGIIVLFEAPPKYRKLR